MNINIWNFVEEYYPNYSSSDNIAYNEDLNKLVNKENYEGENAGFILKRDYDNDIDNPKILNDYNSSLVEIYEKSIMNFYENN